MKFLFKNKRKISVLIFIASFFIVVGYFFGDFKSEKIKTEDMICRGVSFLYEKQKDDGGFDIDECGDWEMEECSETESIFDTTFVLHSLEGVRIEMAGEIKERGIDFLRNEKMPGGTWSFYAKNSGKKLIPDLDDSAMSRHILEKNGEEFENRQGIFENNVNEKNLFYTWINPLGKFNDVDCAVNANVLMYLKKNSNEVCEYINNEIKADRDCAPYYPDKLAKYYIISRAFAEGVGCLEEIRNKTVEDVLKMQKADGSFGSDLQNAFAVNVLINFNHNGAAAKKGISKIIESQKENGSWERGPSWSTGGEDPLFYGSEELTTSLSIEALQKYSEAGF